LSLKDVNNNNNINKIVNINIMYLFLQKYKDTNLKNYRTLLI